MLKFNIRHQSLTRVDSFRPAEKSVNYLYAKIQFLTNEWESADTLILRARSKKEKHVYEAKIENETAKIPWEVLNQSGVFEVSVFARLNDVEITTNYVEIDLGATLPGGSDTNPPTPTELDLLRKEVKEVKEYIENLDFSGNGGFKTDDTLTLKDGILSVNTTDQMEQDNTLPITSAGVFATVGNIEALLQTI